MEVVEFIRSHALALAVLAKFAFGMAIIVGMPQLCRRIRAPRSRRITRHWNRDRALRPRYVRRASAHCRLLRRVGKTAVNVHRGFGDQPRSLPPRPKDGRSFSEIPSMSAATILSSLRATSIREPTNVSPLEPSMSN
jgi:hypothetical protein